jgi:hypothetical protein
VVYEARYRYFAISDLLDCFQLWLFRIRIMLLMRHERRVSMKMRHQDK